MNFVSKIKQSVVNQTSGWKIKSNNYEMLDEVKDNEEQSNPCLEKGTGSQNFSVPRSLNLLAVLPWLLTVIFILTTVFQYSGKRSSVSGYKDLGSFDQGYASDFYPLKSEIKTELVWFTGSPAFTENRTMFLPHPDPIDYNGVGPDVDEAWEELTRGRYILITEEEARKTWPDQYTNFYDPKRKGYVAGLDMFHTLHCVGRLRKLTPETLRKTLDNHNQRMHYYHCLSQIRQYVMCAGDMTPIPTRYYPSIGRNYVDSDMPHTCRNFDKLRDWLTGRYYSVDD